MTAPGGYRGRFAPSPTGPLHFGSLVAAVGSYLDARAHGGEWLVRMEDLDRPRERPGAADDILRTLEAFGFEWDGPVLYQGGRDEAYADAAGRLQAAGLAYPCACTRREVAAAGAAGPEGPVYPGTCRGGLAAGRRTRALRVLTTAEPVEFEDRLLGALREPPGRLSGDFIVRRADGLHAYQLAVVVDDAEQGVNRVVRGADLLASTARQVYLQRLLGLPTPAYMHLPLVRGPDGRKLSKQLGSHPVDRTAPLPALVDALAFLGQPLPEAPVGTTRELWAWAVAHWDPDVVPVSPMDDN